MKTKAIYIGNNENLCSKLNIESTLLLVTRETQPTPALRQKDEIGLIIYEESENKLDDTEIVKFITAELKDSNVLFFVASKEADLEHYAGLGVDEVILFSSPTSDIDKRFHFLKEFKSKISEKQQEEILSYKIPLWKRLFDICFSVIAILLLSPLFIVIAIMIRVESKGKVFYSAKRVGTGYRIFNFYKFRSMYTDADKRVDVLRNQNQYANSEKSNSGLHKAAPDDDNYTLLLNDERILPERDFLEQQKDKQDASFFKISNDPRITRVGRFIRNTSIDELPQLFNVLIGDMSVVGNRPLPLYEAELLTTDRWAKRFLAPAGLTGLWQITKRGGANKMSAEERKQLDIDYANHFTFWGDVKIIMKTFTAMIQHENV